MPFYEDALFSPPAPVAFVTLRSPENGTSITGVPMLLDSGADVTLLPQDAIRRLGLKPSGETQYELTGFAGHQSVSPVVKLELILAGKTFRGQFLLVEQEWGIVGRNILNSLVLTLDGPNLTWSI